MDFEELSKKIEELKAQGKTDEDILDIFFKAFTEEEMDAEDLRKAAGALGYEFSEEFEAELNKELGGGGENDPNISESEFEDTQELHDKETPEEFKEKVEDINERGDNDEEPEGEDEGEEDDEESEDENEDEEWEKAKKMFKI